MEKKLERNQQSQMIAGVASGLADYLLIDVTLIRVIFIVLAVFGFSGVLLYIILWIVVPERSFLQNFPDFNPDYKVQDNPDMYRQSFQPVLPGAKPKSDSGRIVAGLILISLGAWFLLAELDIIPDWFSIFKLWPVILIALGLAIIFKSGKKMPPDLTVSKPPVISPEVKPADEDIIKKDDQTLL
ncbi:PspC domain-containing protein [Pedobacter sp. P351]|uniref:PspC domain-containing protein n=1 Tax=Pedobacter superstes TaxID=3133441 RepID=UPI0030B4647F